MVTTSFGQKWPKVVLADQVATSILMRTSEVGECDFGLLLQRDIENPFPTEANMRYLKSPRFWLVAALIAVNAVLFEARPAEADEPGYFLDCYWVGTPAAFCDYFPFTHCTPATCAPTGLEP